MICYYYPPLTDVGCKRSVAFSKYLKRYGRNPYVLSVKNPDTTYCSLGTDAPPPGIPAEYSQSLVNPYKLFGKINGFLSRLLKLLAIDLKRNYFYEFFCIPDFFWGWIPLTTINGLKIINKYDIDIIYVSCTPYSSAIIGLLLKSITKKPLVIDFRDQLGLEISWFNKTMNSNLKFRRRLDRWFVNSVLKRTDIFIVTSDEIRELYIEQYSHVRGKIFTVHNGFDHDFLPQKGTTSKYSKFTIIYTGDFYSYFLDSLIFFEGMYLLKKKGKVNENNFQFLFYGDGKNEINQIASRYGIEELVVASSRIPYEGVLNEISKSHLQLLRIVKPMISTKVFEGIPLNVPFLATIPKGEVENMIKEYSSSSYVITEESGHKVAEAILDVMEKYNNRDIHDNQVNKFLHNYSRENLTLKLMRIIDKNLR